MEQRLFSEVSSFSHGPSRSDAYCIMISSIRPESQEHALPPFINKNNVYRSTPYIFERLIGYLRPLRLHSLGLSAKTSNSVLGQRCLQHALPFVLLN